MRAAGTSRPGVPCWVLRVEGEILQTACTASTSRWLFALALAAADLALVAPGAGLAQSIALPPQASQLRTHGWKPGAATQIIVHDWRTSDPGRIPIARSGDARTAQSWNPAGEYYVRPRIRTHDSTGHRGGATLEIRVEGDFDVIVLPDGSLRVVRSGSDG